MNSAVCSKTVTDNNWCVRKLWRLASHHLHSVVDSLVMEENNDTFRCFHPFRLHAGVNLQVCFVNDSSSDKDSDAEDSRTETSLDTPLSPVVRSRLLPSLSHWPFAVTESISSAEQAELLVVRSRHGRGGLGPFGWLWRVLAGATEAPRRGQGGTGSGQAHGPNAGGGGEANPTAQTLPSGWLGWLHQPCLSFK